MWCRFARFTSPVEVLVAPSVHVHPEHRQRQLIRFEFRQLLGQIRARVGVPGGIRAVLEDFRSSDQLPGRIADRRGARAHGDAVPVPVA
jgi:hypothetical protein